MSNIEVGLIAIPVLIALIFLRMPIGLAMLACGLGGTAYLLGDWNVVLAKMKTETYSTFSNYSLSIVPLFLLMGQFATLGGMSQSLFRAAEAWLGHRRGGVAMAAVGASAGFGSICGSSLATAATMGQVALPELKRSGYSGGLANATLAAGGTLGILIPPSIVLVIYAIIAEQNIAKLFLAALVPGLLAALGYMLVISAYVRFSPGSEKLHAKINYADRFKALAAIWPVLTIFVLVVGGIYFGWFTPTEAAAIGATSTGIVALFSGKATRQDFVDALLETASNTAMIFLIILGAAYFNGFLALTLLPQETSTYIAGQGFSPWLVLAIILLVYLVFGCFMDSLSMILLTVPIFYPTILGLDFGLTPEEVGLWFGILVLIVVEVGLITPPVGMNLFVINAMDKQTPISATYRAVLPFIASDIARTIVLVAFPAITLALVRWVY